MRRLSRLSAAPLLLIVSLLANSPAAMADGRLYGELHLAPSAVQNTDIDFYPVSGSVTAGVYILPDIGIEVFADAGLESDTSDGFNLNIDDAYGIALRLQSPAERGLRGYIVLGAVNYTLEQTERGGTLDGTRINEEFRGVRASIGFMQRLVRFPALQVSAEYRHYNADEPLRVDALVFGLRINAP